MSDTNVERKRSRSQTPERRDSADSGIVTRSRSSERKKQKIEKDSKNKRRSSFIRGRKSMNLIEDTAPDNGTSGGNYIEEYTDRLKLESSKWDHLYEEYCTAAREAEMWPILARRKVFENTADNDRSAKETTSYIPPWDSLSKEQQRLLGGKPDLQGILDYTKKCREDLEVYVDKISSTTKTISMFESAAEAHVSTMANELGTENFKRMEHFNSPMTLISKIVGKTSQT